MVSSISSMNTIKTASVAKTAAKQSDVKTLVKYLNGESLSQAAADTFGASAKSAASSAVLFEGLPLLGFLKNNKKLNGAFVSEGMKKLGEQNSAALQNLLKGEGKLTKRIADFVKTSTQTNKSFIDLKSVAKAESKMASTAAKATKLAEKAAANPNNKLLQKLANKASAKATNAAAKAANATANTAATAATTGAKAASKLGKFGKFMKTSGAGFMLAFSGIIEGATEVVPTFKELGAEKGMKQLGKSAIKVAGDTFGFIAGQQAGVAAGTAIGTAICPGIGTAVGAVCGFIGGMLGSWVAGKATKAITGKSEREKAAEQQAEQNSKQIANNSQSLAQIKAAALAKLEQEVAMNNGQLSQDSLVAYAALQNLETTNPYAVKY